MHQADQAPRNVVKLLEINIREQLSKPVNYSWIGSIQPNFAPQFR